MAAITVLTGGSTPEREVALAGARQVVAALRRACHDVTVVDTTSGPIDRAQEGSLLPEAVGREPPPARVLADLRRRELGARLVELPALRSADLVFLILHGDQGEGGVVQAILESAGIRYTGSGPLGSAVAMDKDIAKRLFRQAGVPTSDWAMWPASTTEIEALGWPLVVKPSRVGSTLGLTLVKTMAQLDDAVAAARAFDDEVLLERFVSGREFTVGVLGDRALAVGEIVPAHEIFDYECKYTPGMSQEIFPAPIDPALTEQLRAAALAGHRALKLRDFSRLDFRVTPEGAISCLEANTLPGFTRTSLLPQSAAAAGVDFDALCREICELALAR